MPDISPSNPSRAWSPEPEEDAVPARRPQNGPPIRVALIDTHRIYLDALRMALADVPNLEIVWATDDPRADIEALVESRPAVVLIDVEPDSGPALETAAVLRAQLPQARVLFLVGALPVGVLDRMLRCGTVSVLSKTEAVPRIVEHVLRAASGEPRFSEDIARQVTYDRRERRYRPREDATLNLLTSLQLDIVRYLADGDSVRDIADKLKLSPKSIESHSYRVMKVIGVTNRIELARYAIREGLVQP